MEYFVGTLALGVITAVFAFTSKQLDRAEKREEYYRETVVNRLDRVLDILEELARVAAQGGQHAG